MIKQLSSRTVYRNRWMTVREDQVQFKDGRSGIYGVVEKPDFALVVPYQDCHFHLVRQFRYPVGEAYWEFPQGSYEDDPTIDPLHLARQELEEETGLKAASIKKLGFLFEAYGYCNQGFHIFLATDFERGERRLEMSEQDMEVKQVSVEEFQMMVASGEIRDAPTVSAYALLKMQNLI